MWNQFRWFMTYNFAAVLVLAFGAVAALAQDKTSPSQALTQGAQTYDELKDLLKNKYDQTRVAMVREGLFAGERKRGGFGIGAGQAGVIYWHFAPTMEVPKRIGFVKISDLDQIDDNTFGALRKGLNVSSVQAGEALKVSKFYVGDDSISFVLETTGLGHLKDVDVTKASSRTTTSVSQGQVSRSTRVAADFGLFFVFLFNKDFIKSDHDYAAVVSEVNKYLLPLEEAEKLISEKQNIEIQPGMSEEEVVKLLGKPVQTIKFGEQKTLKYEGMTIIIKDNKVVDLKVP